MTTRREFLRSAGLALGACAVLPPSWLVGSPDDQISGEVSAVKLLHLDEVVAHGVAEQITEKESTYRMEGKVWKAVFVPGMFVGTVSAIEYRGEVKHLGTPVHVMLGDTLELYW